MLLSGVTDVQGLASRLLEVALLRVAKVSLSAVRCKCFFSPISTTLPCQFVWAGESQGRVASLPPALVPHLAERRDRAAMVAEVRFLDMLPLTTLVRFLTDILDETHLILLLQSKKFHPLDSIQGTGLLCICNSFGAVLEI